MLEATHLLTRSPLDSARFRLEIWRGLVASDDVPRLWDDIVNVAADVAIFRVRADDIRAMTHFTGPRDALIHADTLVYYGRDLARGSIAAPARSLAHYREARPDDNDALRAVTSRVFASYQNHYHANRLFAGDDILAGYAEWAASHTRPDGATKAWVATDNNAIVGFICCAFNEPAGTAEIILNGVLPEHAGQGIYADLVRIAQGHFDSMGIRHISVSTQVGNYAVQRVWSREGLRLSHAYDTWHVNAMLTRDKQ